MEENSLIIEQTNRMIKAKRRVLITNIILIVIILLIAFYVIKNIEAFKMLSQDVCSLCKLKTGAICYLPIK
jgi:Mn2+/Fe2+ NRAMP family transporter